MEDYKLYKVQCTLLSKALRAIKKELVNNVDNNTRVLLKAVYDVNLFTGAAKERFQINMTTSNGPKTPTCGCGRLEVPAVMEECKLTGYNLQHMVSLFRHVNSQTFLALHAERPLIKTHEEVEEYFNNTLQSLLDGYGIRLAAQASVTMYRNRLADITVAFNHI